MQYHPITNIYKTFFTPGANLIIQAEAKVKGMQRADRKSHRGSGWSPIPPSVSATQTSTIAWST
jgi:hypothetical protein